MIINYTSKVPPEQTIGEIQRLLSNYNVQAMMTEYDGRNVSAVSFKLEIDGKMMSFKLPCNWRAVQQIFIKKNHNIKNTHGRWENLIDGSDEQAIRTAWRVIKDWIEAQLALVEINMVTLPQVFLPYFIMKDGRTLAEKIVADPAFLLGSGN
jgi:hypothetical protein